MYVDSQGTRWYKGNLHTHTTNSDGRKSPDEVIALYKENGYDFLALTDHWKFSQGGQEDGILLLSGCEYDVGSSVQEGIYHIVGIGMEVPPALSKRPGLTAQDLIDGIRAANGIAILAHPAWSINRPDEAIRLTGFTGTEIYNTLSGRPWNARPYSGIFVDEMASRGCLLPCMAADDSHFYEGEECRSYLMVRAEDCTRDSLIAAITHGDFYATQGPELSVRREGDRILVDCSPVEEIVFFTDTVWVPDRVAKAHGVTHGEYQIKPTDTFVRVELFDGEGRSAWSSPMKV